MATSSILGGSPAPEEVSGKDMDALGPSDNTDSGSDARGAYPSDVMSSDTDAAGIGESVSISPGSSEPDADILPDHVEPVSGLDMAGSDPGDVGDLDTLAADDMGEMDDMDDIGGDEDEEGPDSDGNDDEPRPRQA